jgi:hypothetical protein
VRLHILLLHFADVLFVLRGFGALQPLLAIDVDFLEGFRHLAVGEVLKEGVGVEKIGLQQIELGC